MSMPECASPLSGCNEPCLNPSLLDTLNTMKEYIVAYFKTITFDKLVSMEISGHPSDILNLVELHIGEIKKKAALGRVQGL